MSHSCSDSLENAENLGRQHIPQHRQSGSAAPMKERKRHLFAKFALPPGPVNMISKQIFCARWTTSAKVATTDSTASDPKGTTASGKETTVNGSQNSASLETHGKRRKHSRHP